MSLLRPLNLRLDVRGEIVALLERHTGREAVVYDVGCGSKPFTPDLERLGCTYVGVDLADGFYGAQHADVIGSAYEVPVEDGIADAVISCQVLEHLQQPQAALREAHRILRRDGMMYLSSPFLYPIHAAPEDYGRYTRYFIEKVAADGGFELVERRALSGYWYTMGIAAGLYLQMFDRGPLNRIGLMRVLVAAIQWTCLALHRLEGRVLRWRRKNIDDLRESWTVNYVYALRKI
ncbi:MAG: class I SAM-dependent methyltransferase [Alphaproteobacteria bacterium]